ncbi:lysophospholipid acyltransferase family protein [Leptolyngbya ohadii]|uniref:lysophospholipid acyltransferase family protein n=1 Tax=Leptolyngbya ohadii TaxID=1962290 RepID=UPI000B59971B|nr:1-acyl-sn-glycerol-3-phosphate acyltransferase [Leptolyngbya ohadii]
MKSRSSRGGNGSASQPFYPAKINLPLLRGLQHIAPWLIRSRDRVELVISSDPKVQLETLRGRSCLLVCNHPTFDDPKAMFLLSSRLQEPFYYLTAYEQFRGLQGWLYQRLGAYSIRRGLADRDSIAYTLNLLQQPQIKLVIFPEGGCSFQNDTVMPFRSGAVQMALQAMSRKLKQSEPGDADLYIVPISLKYRYTGSMTPVIENTLRRLERALGVSSEGDVYIRLRRVAAKIIDRCEQEAHLAPDPEADWNQRIARLKAEVLDRCEQELGLTSAAGEPNRERVYRILYALEARQNTLMPDGQDALDVMFRAVRRVLNFDAIYDGYVAAMPTPERFLDTLIRLEREVFGIDQPPPKGHRQAFLRIGEPISLKDYHAAYRADRANTVNNLTRQLQQTVQQNLDLLAEATSRGISW